MKRLLRLATHPVGWSLVVGVLLVVGLPALHRALAEKPLPVLATLPQFALVDQDGHPFGPSALHGHPTVVDFVFTTCPTICPKLSATMEDLQAKTRDLPLHFLSISVDPKTDTPPVLAKYGAKFHRDPARWTFVTGDPSAVRDAVVGGFKVELDRTGGDENPSGIVHDGHLVLVDGEARIRGYYTSDDDGLARLVDDARRLSRGDG